MCKHHESLPASFTSFSQQVLDLEQKTEQNWTILCSLLNNDDAAVQTGFLNFESLSGVFEYFKLECIQYWHDPKLQETLTLPTHRPVLQQKKHHKTWYTLQNLVRGQRGQYMPCLIL